VVIEGTIIDVMETWPLQLSVDTREGIYHVALAETTAVTSEGRPEEPAQLLPGRPIRVEGKASNARAMKAARIDIGPHHGYA
jgi:hypothetical protein